ncbi:MAG: hypothetical protein NTX01_06940 [Candidatus Omnitrophica bacterium]|nr:hypothetical protein [Candidatus Omnitrophota bacterium]
MINSNMPYERFMDIFMPGAIVVIGNWYLHRPFLMSNFPIVASGGIGNLAPDLASQGTKMLIFLILSICAGVIVNQFSDAGIVACFNDGSSTDKSKRKIRVFFRFCMTIFTIRRYTDPRISAILYNLRSQRSKWFLEMMEDFTMTNAGKLENDPHEAISAHQHLILKMKTMSAFSNAAIEQLYSPVSFSSSLFIAVVSLFPSALLSFLTTESVRTIVAGHSQWTLSLLCVVIFLLGIIAAYSLKRRFRHFCFQVITYAMHFYKERNERRIIGIRGHNT